MSTACSHPFGAPVNQLSGAAEVYSYADLLKECFGPARALNTEGLDELFEEVEKLLEETDADEDKEM